MHPSGYHKGFRNTFESEAVQGALPTHQNQPRRHPLGLVAEQINGTGFTAQRDANQRVWTYRLRPSATWSSFEAYTPGPVFDGQTSNLPSPQRFFPVARPDIGVDWLAGLQVFAKAGDPSLQSGVAILSYVATMSMKRRFFSNHDGDLLFVPTRGVLRIETELGVLGIEPGWIGVVPQGLRFRVRLDDENSWVSGFVAEVYDGHPRLPERGPIGANGLADARHFEIPKASYEDVADDHELIVKSGNQLFVATLSHSPLDVLAWHGNYYPYRYHLEHFNAYWSASFDHPDPSILTVLTVPTGRQGKNALDLVVFGARYDATEDTFRPPYFHRNAATEFNIVVRGPSGGPWATGTASLTPYLSPHGVSHEAYLRGIAESNEPKEHSNRNLWVQFETTHHLRPTLDVLGSIRSDPDFGASFLEYSKRSWSGQT